MTDKERDVWLDPPAFVAVSITLYVPAPAYVWVGFRWVEAPPSPKLHCHVVGLPVEVSVKLTEAFAFGAEGL